jgi:Coenzyme PQQ synthesis protein D (PqqD)
MDLDKFPIPHPQVAARTVDGSAVIVLADSGEVTVLNPVGTSIWEKIDGAHSIRDIVGALQAEYEVDAAQAEQDVAEFLQTLLEADAVTLADEPRDSTM